MFLFEFEFNVRLRASVKDELADALSRHPADRENKPNFNVPFPVLRIMTADGADKTEENDEIRHILNDALNVITPGLPTVSKAATTAT